MQVVDVGSDCMHQVTLKLGIDTKASKKFIEHVNVLKTPFLVRFVCFNYPFLLLGAHHIIGFVYVVMEARLGVYR